MRLLERAHHSHGLDGYIETRYVRYGDVQTLTLKWFSDANETLYQLRRGMYGEVVLNCHVKQIDRSTRCGRLSS